MLNLFRENLRHFKWILWVVAGTFVVFFGTAWYAVDPNRSGGDWVALVNDEPISTRAWRAVAENLEREMRQLYGQRWAQFREQANVPRMAVERLITQRLVLQDARRMGLRVTDAELAHTIAALPAFQREGRFVGREEYEQAIRRGLLGTTRDPVTFEESLRDDLLLQKWQQILTAGIPVTPEEIEREYRRRHERVTFEYVALPLEQLASGITPTEKELAAYYEAHRDRWAVDEARRALYVLIDDTAVAERIEISDDEIARYYEENKALFTRPEERRARQVLIRVLPDAPASEVEAARERARRIAERIRAGEDFAAIARAESDDEISAPNGGDLGFFPRGRMVPQFDEVVFSLEPGIVSDPFRTDYGFHVVRVEEIREEGLAPLDEVRQQIRDQLRFQRLRDETRALAEQLATLARETGDLRQAAEQLELTVSDSGFISRADTLPGLGPVPELINAIFSTDTGEIGGPVSLPRGEVLFTVEEAVENFLPPLATRREQVLAEFRRDRARELGVERMRQALEATGGDLAAAARRLGVEVGRTEPAFLHGQSLPGIGPDPAVEQVAFATPAGELAGPVAGSRAVVALRVLSRQEADMAKLAEERDQIIAALRAPRAQRLMEARLEELRAAAEIRVNQEFISLES
ncbi:MAG: peptidylprolyl isomerase [Acidobacteriota bacterium]